MWRAPFRAKNEVSQRYSEGVVSIFGPGSGTEKARLRFEELRLGYRRAYEARLAKSEIARVLRVPKGAAEITAGDTAVILGDTTVYAVDLVQYVQDVYPSSVDLTLKVAALAAPAGPHTVTVYNIREDPATFEKTVAVTILQGVLLEAADGAKIAQSGLTPSGKAILRIPWDVDAADKKTGTKRIWAPPRAYAAADEAVRAGLWTLDPNFDFFIKGNVDTAMVFAPKGTDGVLTEDGYLFAGGDLQADEGFQTLKELFDNVYRCSSLAVHDNEPEALWYIEAGGA